MRHHQRQLAAKLGLDDVTEADSGLIQAFHELMASENLDFTLAFRWLTEVANQTLEHSPLPDIFTAPPALTAWAETWQARRKANTGDTASDHERHVYRESDGDSPQPFSTARY